MEAGGNGGWWTVTEVGWEWQSRDLNTGFLPTSQRGPPALLLVHQQSLAFLCAFCAQWNKCSKSQTRIFNRCCDLWNRLGKARGITEMSHPMSAGERTVIEFLLLFYYLCICQRKKINGSSNMAEPQRLCPLRICLWGRGICVLVSHSPSVPCSMRLGVGIVSNKLYLMNLVVPFVRLGPEYPKKVKSVCVCYGGCAYLKWLFCNPELVLLILSENVQ